VFSQKQNKFEKLLHLVGFATEIQVTSLCSYKMTPFCAEKKDASAYMTWIAGKNSLSPVLKISEF
jgi:hypothetical protein